jgi:hypothetical protein
MFGPRGLVYCLLDGRICTSGFRDKASGNLKLLLTAESKWLGISVQNAELLQFSAFEVAGHEQGDHDEVVQPAVTPYGSHARRWITATFCKARIT